jgi:hypothetical protein
MTRELVMVVEDSFVLRGRGVRVMPSLDPDQLPFPAGSPLLIDVVDPQGRSRQVRGRLELEHFILLKGGARWEGAIVLDEGAAPIQAGSTLTARLESQ